MPSEPRAPDPPIAAWRQAAVRYPYAAQTAVGPVDLTMRRGERVLLLGPSGCGKSTLLLTLTGLVPGSIPAEVAGTIRVGGMPASAREPAGWADRVAHFFQDADQTLCGMRVEDEIGFALENRALPARRIGEAVATAMQRVGLPQTWRGRRTMTLSGGEKQLVALAATLVQDADLFVADEPTAHLSPEAARRLHELLVESGPRRAVLIVDHRLDGLIGSIDRVAVLGARGRLVAEGPPRAVFRDHYRALSQEGIWCPAAAHLDAALSEKAGIVANPAPLSMREVLAGLDPAQAEPALVGRAAPIVADFVAARLAPEGGTPPASPPVARLSSAACAPFLGPVVLRDISLEIRAGEVLGILGPNGAGKSTLAACLAGVLRPKSGRREGTAGAIAFQRPETQFTEGSVDEEVAAFLPGRRLPDEAPREVEAILSDWGLAGTGARHPFELSQGQKRRLALAALTADPRWRLIVLDEPLAGLDAHGAAQVEAGIARLRAQDRAVAVITHDMDFALRVCPRSIVLAEGTIIARGPTPRLFGDTRLLARAGLDEPALAPAMAWLEKVNGKPAC